MHRDSQPHDEPTREIERLRLRLDEAEATIQAIRGGMVDAIVIDSPHPTLYTLDGAERPYRLLVETMRQGVAIVNDEGIIVFCNPFLANLTRCPLDSIIGNAFAKFLVGSDASACVQRMLNSSGSKVNHEFVLKQEAGSTIPVAITLNKLPLNQTAVLVSDLSERKQHEQLLASKEAILKSEEALRQKAEELQTLIDTLPIGIFIAHDTQNQQVSGNNAIRDLLRLPVKQTAPKSPQGCQYPTHFRVCKDGVEIPDNQLPIHRAATGERISNEEIQVVLDDSTILDFLIFAAPLFDPTGQPRGAVGGLVDITERKTAEKELLLATERFHVALKDSNIVVFNQDLDLRYTWVHNPALGYAAHEVIGKQDCDLLERPEDAERLEEVKRGVLQSGVSQHTEVILQHQGVDYYYDLRVDPAFSPNGEICGITCAAIDVTQRKHSEQSLVNADLRKNEFLAILAHELRNPLAPLRNGLQLMSIAKDDKAVVEHVRVMMDRQLTQLVRLVDDLLDISRIKQGKLELQKNKITLQEVIDSAVETCKPTLEQMEHALNITMPSRAIPVDADLTRLAQVFMNLLNNAAKYSDPKSTITLTVEPHGNEVVVSVKDNGIGIARDHLPFVFEMFSQVQASLHRSQGGLGIGLSLVKQLVHMHGGTIEARSDGLGCGSEFTVRLPCLSEKSERDKNDHPTGNCAISGLRILIVDDNRDSADSLAMMLRALGNETKTAYDGEQAVEAWQSYLPDVTLLDIGLPNLNGYEVCKRIRKLEGGSTTVLVAQTGWGQDEDRKRSADAGFDHHLVKPLDPSTLMQLLRPLIKPHLPQPHLNARELLGRVHAEPKAGDSGH